MFDSFGNGMSYLPERNKADIRFYCDDDDYGEGKRWTITPDDPDDPADVKNSLLPRTGPKTGPGSEGPFQQWQDTKNWIRMGRGHMGCKHPEPEDNRVMGIVHFRKFEVENMTPADINPDRCTVTLCDFKLSKTKYGVSEGEAPESEVDVADLQKYLDKDEISIQNSLEVHDALLSGTLLHELTHITKPGMDTDDHTYNYKKMIQLTSAQALDNAETYAIYAFIARLADFKFRVDNLDEGTIRYDKDLETVGGEDLMPDPVDLPRPPIIESGLRPGAEAMRDATIAV
ncbi:hypothetical protein DPSP01_001810 [Paraphaeosphaeria sporulosa]